MPLAEARFGNLLLNDFFRLPYGMAPPDDGWKSVYQKTGDTQAFLISRDGQSRLPQPGIRDIDPKCPVFRGNWTVRGKFRITLPRTRLRSRAA